MAVQRKISLFQLLLGCVLLTLLVAKALPYVVPTRLLPQQFYSAMIAQDRGQDPNQVNGQNRNEGENSVRITPETDRVAPQPNQGAASLLEGATTVQKTCSLNTPAPAPPAQPGVKKTLPTYFEYNLQRQCGQTSEKVLDNFLDEYSVSCMPRSAYIVDLIAQDKCGLTTKGCANWNNTGELKLTADNSLFGLYRDETKVTARAGTTDLQQKNRRESLEAYFTGKLDTNQLDPSEINTEVDEDLLDTYQAPLYKNSTPEQQCSLIYNKLVAVKELCDPINRIEGDTELECAINQYLPGSTTRYLDVLNTIGKESNCKSIMSTDARKDILAIDPGLEVAYRPAFIVMATVTNDKEHANNPEVRVPGTSPDRFTQVDYLEIKVPSFGSDHQDRKSASSNPDRPGSTYIDPLRFTADVLTTTETQEKHREEEEKERNQIRGAAEAYVPAPAGPITGGPLIGKTEVGDAPVKCRAKDSATFSEANCDNIARALISFINASAALTVDDKSVHRAFSPNQKWIPSVSKCEVDETDLNGADAANSGFEEAASLGSSLEAKDVGPYQKKTSATTDMEVFVPSLAQPPGRGTRIATTRIFFISPHNYTLMYARNAAMGLLTTEQQDSVLADENFSAVLKTSGVDTFKSDRTIENYLEGTTQYQVSTQTQREKADEVERKSPILWQTAASVANLFTRQFALLSTTTESKTHQDTLKCTGPNATENWLKGNCNPVKNTAVDGSLDSVEDGLPAGASDKCVQLYVDSKAEAETMANVIRQNLPGQHDQWIRELTSPWLRPTARRMNLFFKYDQCNNELCYNYIMRRAIEETNPIINPQFLIAIALSESRGLRNNDPNDSTGVHFGCGLSGPKYDGYVIGSKTIPEKLDCVFDFFKRNKDLSPDEAMTLYGYRNGWRNRHMNKYLDILTAGNRADACSDGEEPDTL